MFYALRFLAKFLRSVKISGIRILVQTSGEAPGEGWSLTDAEPLQCTLISVIIISRQP